MDRQHHTTIIVPLMLPLLCVTFAIACSLPAQSPGSAWLEDLDFLAQELPKRHKNAFFSLPKPEWAERVAGLKERIPKLDDAVIMAELMQLVAALGDSHTMLQPPALLKPGVPLRLVVWPDAVRVFGIGKENSALLGARIVAIEGKPIEQVETLVAKLLAADNVGARRLQLPTLLTRTSLLHALGVSKTSESLRYDLETADGKKQELVLTPGELARDAAFDRPSKVCVTDQRGRLWHHFEMLADDRIAYVQYNRCATDAEHDLAAFTEKVRAACAEAPPKAWIFDLQYNGGGNSVLGDMMFATLIPKGARVFAIIGPQTFSSGFMNAMALKERYGATLIGRPTGGKPAHFGEVRTFTLPKSQIVVQYSTKHFVHGDPKADSLPPDHEVARSYADFKAGKDLLLEKVRELAK